MDTVLVMNLPPVGLGVVVARVVVTEIQKFNFFSIDIKSFVVYYIITIYTGYTKKVNNHKMAYINQTSS